jgi:hypothetical protein
VSSVEDLHLFLRRVEELGATRLVQGGFGAGLSINFDRVRGLRFTTRYPDEEDLRSYLLTFRRFVLRKERVSYRRIYDFCFEHVTSDDMKQRLVEARQGWVASLRDGGFGLVVDDTSHHPEHVLDLWINGHYFHDDSAKLAALDCLAPVSVILSKFAFLNAVIEATKQVIYLRNLVGIALKEGLIRE